jgi:HD-like signal output (HDOD) protein
MGGRSTPLATEEDKWIDARVAHYIRKSWCVPDAITQAIADRHALVATINRDDARAIARAACDIASTRSRQRGRAP